MLLPSICSQPATATGDRSQRQSREKESALPQLHDRRVKSFIERLETKHPDVKVVARAVTNQDATKAYQAVLSMAQAHPNLAAVFMPEATSGMGAAQAATELGSKIKILTCDVNAQLLDMIKAGKVWGAINPNQGMQGYMGMLSLFMSSLRSL